MFARTRGCSRPSSSSCTASTLGDGGAAHPSLCISAGDGCRPSGMSTTRTAAPAEVAGCHFRRSLLFSPRSSGDWSLRLLVAADAHATGKTTMVPDL